MSLTFTDIFCGAGGTSTGMVEKWDLLHRMQPLGVVE
jgi:hypothetical protein